jgi:hypothetical protein
VCTRVSVCMHTATVVTVRLELVVQPQRKACADSGRACTHVWEGCGGAGPCGSNQVPAVSLWLCRGVYISARVVGCITLVGQSGSQGRLLLSVCCCTRCKQGLLSLLSCAPPALFCACQCIQCAVVLSGIPAVRSTFCQASSAVVLPCNQPGSCIAMHVQQLYCPCTQSAESAVSCAALPSLCLVPRPCRSCFQSI